ncbi:hypothetical protein [Kitasatospora griseola]|uniref:hypothetical protein n=1 Tax=Kitasatospora griseola TaxID=2064 RepID=UPI001670EC43|nr:hypothetical protein [Kitasatospora griseola]GGQ63725.1 hypothetical protein GCM10010195_19200 [Kitasatospora griseola]
MDEGLEQEQDLPADASEAVQAAMMALTTGAPEGQKELATLIANLRQQALLNFGEMNLIKIYSELDPEHAELSDGYLNAVRAVFEPPKGFDDAYTAWKAARGALLVLNSGQGTGRTVAAHALLARLRAEGGGTVRVGSIPFGGSQNFPIRRLPRADNWAYVLELPPDEEEFQVSSTFGDTLARLQYALEKRNCRLIVLTSPEQWTRINLGAPQGICPSLGEVDPVEMARRWLLAEAADIAADEWLGDPRIRGLLRDQEPAEVLRIVSLVLAANREETSSLPSLEEHAARQETVGDPVFHRRVQSVLLAHRNWREELLKWHCEPERTSFQRNFMLVAAVLRKASVAHVYAATASLCKKLDGEVIRLSGQQAPGVIQMMDAINAQPSGDGALTFSKPAWDDAVVEYFWEDRPLARKPFLDWLASAPGGDGVKEALETLSAADRKVMAERISGFAVQWAVRQQRPDPLRTIVLAWRRDDQLWQTALCVLNEAAVQPASAGYIHAILLRWARGTDPALRMAAVQVCAGDFGRLYTGKALRRLKHAAAGAGDDGVKEALRSAVTTLWADQSARSTLLGYVTEWCREPGGKADAGRRCFAVLANEYTAADSNLPALLVDSSEFRAAPEQLTAGWRALLGFDEGSGDGEEARAAVELWLAAALAHPDRRTDILNVLQRAIDHNEQAGRTSTRERLRAFALQWVLDVPDPARRERDELYTELSKLIDRILLLRLNRTMGRSPDRSGNLA